MTTPAPRRSDDSYVLSSRNDQPITTVASIAHAALAVSHGDPQLAIAWIERQPGGDSELMRDVRLWLSGGATQ